ncbi:MAG: S1 RNA-binding domain-containing protein [Clostridiales bacterium]|nr:S1 RNA-binding domain-containing protein [Clostridiales bacterium]
MPQRQYLPEGILIGTEENLAYISSINGLEKAMTDGIILEARAVVCDASHNLMVDLGGISGMIPRSEAAIGISSGTTREIAVISRVGRPVCFKVVSIEAVNGKPQAILSRKAAQEEALNYFMATLNTGDIISARVTHLEPFGAFVDIGCGNTSLIGIENISVSRISHPSERFEAGQDIYAAVLSKDLTLRRISLTHRELLGTWEQNASAFSAGETVRGIIRGIEEYGIFVELSPNLSGLAEKKEGLTEGQLVSVFIKSIIPERMKIKLLIIDSFHEAPPRTPLKYFIQGARIDRWIYTPEGCLSKTVETIF